MSKEKEMIGIENIVVALYIKLRNECLDELKEIGMNPNLIVCRIREYGRKWEKEIVNIDGYDIKSDGFIKLIKKDLMNDKCPEELKRALKYL